MLYSKYFSTINKQHTFSSLSTTQVDRIMNIVALERSISTIKKIKASYEDTPYYNKQDLFLIKEQRLLTDLTGNIKPKELLLEMDRLTKNS